MAEKKIPTPAELAQKQLGQDNLLIEQAKALIIHELENKYVVGNGPVDRNFAASSINDRVKQAIVSDFAKKGWSVHFGELKSSVTEGSYYEVRIQANS